MYVYILFFIIYYPTPATVSANERYMHALIAKDASPQAAALDRSQDVQQTVMTQPRNAGPCRLRPPVQDAIAGSEESPFHQA